jgi:hypothetical protein
LESQQRDYYTPPGGSTTSGNPWADSDQRGLITHPSSSSQDDPQQQQQQQLQDTPVSNDYGAPMGSTSEDQTSEWTLHDTTNPMNATHEEPFANPFALEESTKTERPAYGNLQG